MIMLRPMVQSLSLVALSSTTIITGWLTTLLSQEPGMTVPEAAFITVFQDCSWFRSSKRYSFSDILVPSHYYRILVRCTEGWATSHCRGDASVLSFILPNIAAMDNCMVKNGRCHPHFLGWKSTLPFQDPRPYLQMHMARVRDIELLTGLEFFMSTGLEQGQLHRSILHRTNITEDLW